MEATEVLAIVGGHVEQELLLRNEYPVAENEILKSKIEGCVRLTSPDRIRLAKIAKRLGRKALEGVPCIVKPDTLLRWYRDLVAKKFDGSKQRRGPGRPRVTPEIEELVVRVAEEDPGWGYDRIQGALANMGHVICDETVGNILRRNGIPPAPDRKKNTTWTDFIHAHSGFIAAMDFFTTEVIIHDGLLTVYVLFVIRLASREVHVAGLTPHPDEEWMKQMARNLTMADAGFLDGTRYLLHDRDSKFCCSFEQILRWAGVTPVKLPAQSPNLNAIAERFVRSVKSECLSKLLLFGEGALRRALSEYVQHYHTERNHQGKGNQILFPENQSQSGGLVACKQRLGGVLKFYYREAA